jgi:flagellar biosynthesis protein FliQ
VLVAVLSTSTTIGTLVAILAITGMSVLTLSNQPRLHKKIVALWVFGPVLLSILCGAGFVYFSRASNHLSNISSDSINLFDLHMSLA